jgi:hypothetical protein
MFDKVKQDATKLVEKLNRDIHTGQRLICENYGQLEIRNFKDTEEYQNLTWNEQCEINVILMQVADIH